MTPARIIISFDNAEDAKEAFNRLEFFQQLDGNSPWPNLLPNINPLHLKNGMVLEVWDHQQEIFVDPTRHSPAMESK